jgi:hypothetical protein
VTFTEHIAPILYDNCVTCHRPGEAAPFSLISYEAAGEARVAHGIGSPKSRYMAAVACQNRFRRLRGRASN